MALVLARAGGFGARAAATAASTGSLRRAWGAPRWPGGGATVRCSWLNQASRRAAGTTAETAPADEKAQATEEIKAVPLAISSPLTLYRSPRDAKTVAETAGTQCFAGAALALCGFAGVLVGAPTAPAGMQALVCLGGVLNTYKHVVMARGEIALTGMRHAEQIVAQPNAVDGELEPEAAGELTERLKATKQLEVEVRTASMLLKLTLVEPSGAWEGAKYAGLVADERATFGDVCQVLCLEQVSGWGKQGAPTSEDSELLAGLVASGKVLADCSVEPLPGLEGALRPPQDAPARFQTLIDAAAAKRLADSRQMSSRVGPAQEMQQIGRSAVISGTIFMLAGFMYIGRWFSGEVDATGVKKEPQQLVEQWRVRLSGEDRA